MASKFPTDTSLMIKTVRKAKVMQIEFCRRNKIKCEDTEQINSIAKRVPKAETNKWPHALLSGYS